MQEYERTKKPKLKIAKCLKRPIFTDDLTHIMKVYLGLGRISSLTL